MDCVVAPFDHKLLLAEEDVSTTFPPEQKVVGPPAVIVGTAGTGLTVTETAEEIGDVHSPVVSETE
jgi:hypothetical protein